MRVTVVGAGAVGGVVAAAAAAAGHDVAVCVRTPIDVLEVERDGVTTAVRASLLTSPVDEPSDVVFVTVKATDNPSTAPFLATACGPGTLTVVVQNGLDHAARVGPLLPGGAGPVTGALAYLAAERRAPGRIRHTHGDLLFVDEAHAEAIGKAVADGLRVRGSDDFHTEAWRKLLANLVANPITAITLQRTDVLGAPALAALARSILEEAVAVGKADGARLAAADVDRVLEGISRFGRTGSSMLYDRRAGRPMEHHHLTGEVVRRGEAHGVPTPVNATLLALLDALEAA